MNLCNQYHRPVKWGVRQNCNDSIAACQIKNLVSHAFSLAISDVLSCVGQKITWCQYERRVLNDSLATTGLMGNSRIRSPLAMLSK